MFHFNTPENLGFSDVFGGYRGRTLVKIKRKNLEKQISWNGHAHTICYNTTKIFIYYRVKSRMLIVKVRISIVEAYSEPCQTPKIDLFVKIINRSMVFERVQMFRRVLNTRQWSNAFCKVFFVVAPLYRLIYVTVFLKLGRKWSFLS